MRFDTGQGRARARDVLLQLTMPAGLRRAVWLLGLCQCVLWGVLYYSFSVLLVPLEHGLGLPRTAVASAFSLGLFAMAIAAPMVGKWLDRGHAARSFRVGAGLAVGGLLALSQAQGMGWLLAAWTLLGVAMAMLLYESAFAMVIRAVTEADQRLRALAAVTVMGGLASTVFLPVVSSIVEHLGWRSAALSCAAAVVIVAVLMERFVLPDLASRGEAGVGRQASGGPWPAHFPALVALFGVGTLASMALTTLLVPLLLQHGTTPTLAATVLGALGIAQLPGRIWLLRGGSRAAGRSLLVVPVAMQAAGMLIVATLPSPWIAALGVAVFGLGAGLQTLARPWLVQALYGVADCGRWNGELARIQGFARAAGPVIAAAAAWLGGSQMVLVVLCLALALTLLMVRRLQTAAGLVG